MTINNTSGLIRQQQPGQFSVSGDGKGPYAHIDGNKILSKWDQGKGSAYVNNKKVLTFQPGLRAETFKILDSDPGIKVSAEKTSDTKKEGNLDQQYDKTGKAQTMTQDEQGGRIDEWV